MMRTSFLSVLLCLIFSSSLLAKDINDYLFQGADYHYQGKLDEAGQVFKQALQIETNNEFALNQLGLIYAKQEKFKEAVKLFRRVVQVSPENTFARVWLGILSLQENRVNTAAKQFNETLGIDPNNANAYYFLGVIYAVEHNPVKAVEYLRKAQSVGSDDPETHYRLARAFLGLDMVYNAQLEFERTLALSPKHTKAMNLLGWVLYNRGEKKLAFKKWEQVLKINPKDAEARLSLSKAYNDEAYAAYKAGRAAEARGLWKKTLAHEPNNKAAKYYLRKLK